MMLKKLIAALEKPAKKRGEKSVGTSLLHCNNKCMMYLHKVCQLCINKGNNIHID